MCVYIPTLHRFPGTKKYDLRDGGELATKKVNTFN